jgi:glycosyltransferase involved in cell wall biosynthesis
MALGTPVVSTSKGVEGLDLTNGHDVIIADEPRAFADSVVSLLDDTAMRTRIGSQARDTVAAIYDWRVIGNTFCDFVERVAEHEVERVRR